MFCVLDETDRRLIGTVSFVELAGIVFDPGVDELVNAGDAARKLTLTLVPEDGLERALELMEALGEEHVPVLVDAATGRVAGLLHRSDALRRLNRALFEAQAEEHDEAADLYRPAIDRPVRGPR